MLLLLAGIKLLRLLHANAVAFLFEWAVEDDGRGDGNSPQAYGAR